MSDALSAEASILQTGQSKSIPSVKIYIITSTPVSYTHLDVYKRQDVDDSVKILNGALAGFIGTVQEINKEKGKVKVLVSMFGRETPVELELAQVEKV